MLLVLIRHAHTGAIGQVLAGRAAGHSLDATGRAEAARLAQRLAPTPLDAVYA
ncbi:MAG: histidine phosphatase family protein, partial [Gemmatimonadota bacterium]|nr:histidine phosphatase family protein [Gemmatimonadota bacterium]